VSSRSPVPGRVRALVIACVLAALPARGEEVAPLTRDADADTREVPEGDAAVVDAAEEPPRPTGPTLSEGASAAQQPSKFPERTSDRSVERSLPSEPQLAEPEALPEVPQDALEEIVIVGRRPRGEVARDPTAAATVIEAERFAGEAKGVAELVATAPGVAVSQYGGLGHFSTVSIRGSTADGVLVLVDGLPLNTAAGGAVDLASIPRHWIDRIEVVRGPEGAAYGAGALGGVVNVVTRRPRGERGSAEATVGSFDTYGAGLEGAAELGGAAVLAILAAESTGGTFPYRFDPQPTVPGNALVDEWRRNDGVRRAGLLTKLAASAGPVRLDALAQLSVGRRDLPGWPYALTPRNWQEDARALLSLRAAAPGPLDGQLVAARGSLRLDRLEARIDPARVDQRGVAGGLEVETLLERGDLFLRLAASGEAESLRAIGLGRERARLSAAAVASGEARAAGGRLRIGPAVRAERVGEHAGVSTKLGGSVRLAGPLALRASAGRTFRAPSLSELYLTQGIVAPNPELRSEVGTGADAALVLDSPFGFASVGAHATLYRDLIYYEQATREQLKPFNSGKALARGVEAEVATAPARALLGLSLGASYTLLFAENLRGGPETVGASIPFRARHRGYARVAVAPGSATAHVELHAVGRQYGDARNLGVIPATTSWNAGGSLRLARAAALRLHLEVRNLLDDRTLVDVFGHPLPSRTVLVTLRGGSSSQGTP
jgi:vitamin B12 transporter